MMYRVFITILLIDISISILVKNEERVLSVNYPMQQNTKFQDTPDKFEAVKMFLRHYNSLRPVAILVDDTEESCENAATFVGKVFELATRTSQIKFLIYKFNESGILPLDEMYGNETEKIDALLSYGREQYFLGTHKSNGTLAFFAILNAAAKLPKSSAVLMFVDRKIQDEDLANHVAILTAKDIKVYVVWGGKSSTKSNEERLLRQVCDYTGGLFLVNTWKSRNRSNYRKYLEMHSGNVNTSIVDSRRNLKGSTEFEFPIDGEVMGIHLRISPPNTEGTLTTPRGAKIELQSEDTITSYGDVSFDVADDTLREIYLDAAAAPKVDVVGQWRASFRNRLAPYNVTVFVDAPLTANATLVQKDKDSRTTTGQVLKLGIAGSVGDVNHISFLDKSGHAILNKTLNGKANKELITSANWNSKYSRQYHEFNVEVDNITELFSIYVHGKDGTGNKFSRMAYVGQQSDSNLKVRPSLTIDVGEGSTLRADGGEKPLIIFEVTNMNSEAVRVKFYCQDTKSLLLEMDPQSRLMSPLESAKVKLTLTAVYGSYQDEVTFIAEAGNEFVRKKVLVDIGMTHVKDNNGPSLDYTFPSDCSQVALANCGDGMWTVQVKARDSGSGLLQVTSYPRGIYFPDNFVTGTKDYVTGVYSESCCNPDLRVTAIDIDNNRNTITINAFRSSWNAAQISALVLGILILIIIIAILIFLCVRCKRKDSFELPRYRGGNDI